MTMDHFWRFLREAKILNSELTLAAFNRLFIKGVKNNFDLHCDFKRLAVNIKNQMRSHREKLERMNKFGGINQDIKEEESEEEEEDESPEKEQTEKEKTEPPP